MNAKETKQALSPHHHDASMQRSWVCLGEHRQVSGFSLQRQIKEMKEGSELPGAGVLRERASPLRWRRAEQRCAEKRFQSVF